MFKKGKILTKPIILFFIFLFFLIIIFLNLGQWLIVRDELFNSEVILVLAGSFPDRILHSIDIFNQHYAEKIVFVDSCKGNHNNGKEKIAEIPQGYAQLNNAFAIKSGIPKEDLLIIDGDAKSTRDEALIMKAFLNNNQEIDSLILVTSKYHSRRAKQIFVNVLNSLNRNIRIYSSPSEYDNFNGKKWWKNKRDIKLVLVEYLKMANFFFVNNSF